MLVHAHPDDESSQSPATMARYVAEGAQVTLVTCTLGERGEILVPEWQHYSPEELGAHRLNELASALGILGVTDHVWLGGPGTYHDTGMAVDENGTIYAPADAPENAFWKADLLQAACHLVELIRARRPQVVSTYDTVGGYGHPDHIQAHRVTMYACALAGADFRPELGEPWQVQRVVWSTHNTTQWARAARLAKEHGLDLFDDWDGEDTSQFGTDPAQIRAVVPIGEFIEQCSQALRSHRSQVDTEHEFWKFYSLMQSQEDSGEAYLFASGVPFPEGGIATDLFAGLETS